MGQAPNPATDEAFSDESMYLAHGLPSELYFRAGGAVDGFRIRYGSEWGSLHGKEGGNMHHIFLESEERITRIDGML